MGDSMGDSPEPIHGSQPRIGGHVQEASPHSITNQWCDSGGYIPQTEPIWGRIFPICKIGIVRSIP